MLLRSSLLALLAALWSPSIGWSILIDTARPITHQVNVRLVETALNNGTSPATTFGDAFQRAEIEANVDAIWAQAGIDVNFLPTVVRYNDTFALQGTMSPGTVRPAGDLNLVLSGAASNGSILHADNSVINMFMVDVVPGFSLRGENWGGGLAHVGANGMTLNVGENLLTSPGGREAVATLIAHEIGHNLGLRHATDGAPNLMASKRSSAQLSDAQIEAIFQWHFRSDSVAFIPQGGTGFPQLILEPLAGDFTHNGIVDAGDYSLWRNTLGSRTSLAADANRNLVVDVGDYDIWKSNFGSSILPPELPGDYNLDGTVNSADYSVWRDALGSRTNLVADGNRNQVIDNGDYNVWKNNFGMTLLTQSVSGDYNGDGAVNAADYSLWRDTLGSVTNLSADGDGNRIVDEGDYRVWKNNFGAGFGSGSGSSLADVVPEPSVGVLLMIAIITLAQTQRALRG